MTQVITEPPRNDTVTDSSVRQIFKPHPRFRTLALAVIASCLLVAALYPSLRAGFWSWDWYWIDQHAQGNTAWGGPFYQISEHANPLPVEVQWYRATLDLLGLNPLPHHLLTLAGLLGTLWMLFLLARRLGIPDWAGAGAVVLAGMAPAALTSWTWFAASPHMWAALLGLGAAVAHIAWRQGGSASRLLAVAPVVLTVLGLAMKNDAVIGPLLILAWEWTAPRGERKTGRAAVSAAAVLPMAAFVWWQATAIDPHRDQAQTGLWQVADNLVGLIRFAFLWRSEAELQAEFPPAAAPPAALTIAGLVVGIAVLALAIASLWTRAGRVLMAAGLASAGPVAVLQPALLSRYVLTLVLLITLASAAGAAHLARWRTPQGFGRAAAIGAAVAAVAVWGTLAHLSSGAGANATREEQALLQALVQSGLSPDDEVAVRLVNSPLEPSTAAYRQFDPRLAPSERLQRLRFLLPGQSAPHDVPLVILTRQPDGTYLLTKQ